MNFDEKKNALHFHLMITEKLQNKSRRKNSSNSGNTLIKTELCHILNGANNFLATFLCVFLFSTLCLLIFILNSTSHLISNLFYTISKKSVIVLKLNFLCFLCKI
jgi:hypothetical protein